MRLVSEQFGYVLLILFALTMVAVTYLFARWKRWDTRDGFLVANRKVNWFLGGTSIAASWIWAPALFVSVQMSYEKGLAGMLWFTIPNILALMIFAFFAPQIRAKIPRGFTFPQFIKHRFGSKRLHVMFLITHLFYQLMAVTVQIYAGGSLLSLLTGIPLIVIMPTLLLIALTYTLVSGLVATIVTDFVHIAMIFVIGALIIPWTCWEAGGFSAITAGFGGVENIKSIFDPAVAFSFGIVTSIGLLSGAISDQQCWQRAFAIKDGQLVKAYTFGAIVFGVVPTAISTLGFLAANPALDIKLPIAADNAFIGVQTIVHFLPTWAVALFVVMVLAGLSSALDSGLSAASSLWVIDVCKGKSAASQTIMSARKAMIGICIAGLLVGVLIQIIPGFGLKQLWWVFNAIAACVVVPTILSLYWDGLSERGVFWGIVFAFGAGFPLFIWANLGGQPAYVVAASLFIIGVSSIFCLAVRQNSKTVSMVTISSCVAQDQELMSLNCEL